MTPYELRFKIFKQAYNMLSDNYQAKYVELQESNGGKIPEGFSAPVPYPDIQDVISQAEVINTFVSEAK